MSVHSSSDWGDLDKALRSDEDSGEDDGAMKKPSAEDEEEEDEKDAAREVRYRSEF